MTNNEIIISGSQCNSYDDGICYNDNVAIAYCKDCDFCQYKLMNLYRIKLLYKEKTIIEIKELIESNCKICKDFESRICAYCNYNKIMDKINEAMNDLEHAKL